MLLVKKTLIFKKSILKILTLQNKLKINGLRSDLTSNSESTYKIEPE